MEYQEDIYKENASKKRRIKTDEQYREYQVWHIGVQEELDELKQEKREIKRQLQLADGIMREDLYTAYYAASENEEIVADRDIEIPRMEELEVVSEVKRKDTADIEDVDTEVYRKEDVSVADQYSDIEKEQADLYVVKFREMDADKVEWIAERLSACGAYEEINAAVKADIFVLDIAYVSGSIRLFSDVMKRLGIKLDGDELMRSSRGFMMRVSIEMLAKIKQKIRCGIGAEGDDSSAYPRFTLHT